VAVLDPTSSWPTPGNGWRSHGVGTPELTYRHTVGGGSSKSPVEPLVDS
jgi:hypothetical protein